MEAHEEITVSTRLDRELRKKLINPGDYNIVPFEESRCKIKLSDIQCTNDSGSCEIDPESTIIFSSDFRGNVLIGDNDNFIDRDFELVLQQMCEGETALVTMVYRDNDGKLVKQICCKVELLEVTEEQLISDWSIDRLYEACLHHKEKGVELVKQQKFTEAFRRFQKSFKMLVAIEPIDNTVVDELRIQEMRSTKVKLYNNIAHIQVKFDEHTPALELCNRALKIDPENVKALFRRSLAYTGLEQYEDAWNDIQHVLRLDPNDKLAQQHAKKLQPIMDKIKKSYTQVIKKMFTS